MAPRGGGGGGRGGGGGSSSHSSGSDDSGSSSSSSSSSSSTTDSNNSFNFGSSYWTTKEKLVGENFHDGYQVAQLAFLCICFLIILGVGISSFSIKNKREVGRRHFGLFGFGLAWITILCSFILLILNIAFTQSGFTVDRIYILVYIFQLFFDLLSDLFLLLVLYGIVQSGLQSGGGRARFKASTLLHKIVLGILFLLAIGIMVYYILFFVQGNGDFNQSEQSGDYHGYGRLLAIFNIIYFLAAVEILAFALMTVVRKNHEHISRKAAVLFLGLVAIPNIIRTLYDLIISVKYDLPSSLTSPLPPAYLQVVFIVFELIPHTITFVGILLVAKAEYSSGPRMGAPNAGLPGNPAGEVTYGNAAPVNGYAAQAAPLENKYPNARVPPPRAASPGHQWAQPAQAPPPQYPVAGGHAGYAPPHSPPVSSVSSYAPPHGAPPQQLE